MSAEVLRTCVLDSTSILFLYIVSPTCLHSGKLTTLRAGWLMYQWINRQLSLVEFHTLQKWHASKLINNPLPKWWILYYLWIFNSVGHECLLCRFTLNVYHTGWCQIACNVCGSEFDWVMALLHLTRHLLTSLPLPLCLESSHTFPPKAFGILFCSVLQNVNDY